VSGPWEGDLLMGKRQAAIGTLVERWSRYVMLFALAWSGLGLILRPIMTPVLRGIARPEVRNRQQSRLRVAETRRAQIEREQAELGSSRSEDEPRVRKPLGEVRSGLTRVQTFRDQLRKIPDPLIEDNRFDRGRFVALLANSSTYLPPGRVGLALPPGTRGSSRTPLYRDPRARGARRRWDG
jgi:hypothetical protein